MGWRGRCRNEVYGMLPLLVDSAWLDHRSATRQLQRIFGKYGGAGEANAPN
jgi:hypothetical protein